MCYAIPGKIISIENDIATIDYFGEYRKARIINSGNLTLETRQDPKPKTKDPRLRTGDFVYAQGGIIVDVVEEAEALAILEEWKERFFELKKTDEQQSITATSEVVNENNIPTHAGMLDIIRINDTAKLQSLYKKANAARAKHIQNACCVHGIIEFSNYCQNDCTYCGINKNNKKITRYRMSEVEITETAVHAVKELGFKALVLQSGEDSFYTDGLLISIIKKIREHCGVLLFISIGERSAACYRRLYDAGAYGALLRFETSNAELYSSLHPQSKRKLSDRLALIRELKQIGFVLATGFMVGLPGETEQDLINNILLTKSINPDMFSFGPFIPHPHTQLASSAKLSSELALKTIALSRLVAPDSHILVTTALETLDHEAKRKALLAGANSLMINVTPGKYCRYYDIYPGKMQDTENKTTKGKKPKTQDTIRETLNLLYSLGRAPTDLLK